jgi:hypothetical protein
MGERPEDERAAEPLCEQCFLADDPRGVRVQERPLSQYLLERGLNWVIKLRTTLEAMDFGALTRNYSARGRRAPHPRTALGLITYGMLRRQWSLRELEIFIAVRPGVNCFPSSATTPTAGSGDMCATKG